MPLIDVIDRPGLLYQDLENKTPTFPCLSLAEWDARDVTIAVRGCEEKGAVFSPLFSI